MIIKPVVLWTDLFIYILLATSIGFFLFARRQEPMILAWQKIKRRKLAVLAMVVLVVYASIGLLDSFHFRFKLKQNGNQQVAHYAPQVHSLLDYLLGPIASMQERSYSAPFALKQFTKETRTLGPDEVQRYYPKLLYPPKSITTASEKYGDILALLSRALLATLITFGLLCAVILLRRRKQHHWKRRKMLSLLIRNNPYFPWRLLMLSLFATLFVVFSISFLATHYHVFGTDKVGTDVLYQTIKSIRTGLVIGLLTTLIMLPFAIMLGLMAGYFGGLVDDAIQYLYTTLSSIPGVLLIAAAILSIQIYIANHPQHFHTLVERADVRLLALCIILGITSWTGLCRLLRAETLKLREIDYVQAAKSLGTSRLWILTKHLLPNVMHLVIIAVVLDFSSLVLAEAVLSYVGVGVDPTAMSWGNMINSARLELARDPIVWWPLLAAFVFMFILVLSANLLSDAVRDGFDPRHSMEG